ncbi:MAG: acyl-CoA dehydrogenase family protein, partial [Fidelibacterota bacterium]
MDFTFTEEQQMLRDMCRKFTENEIKPLADKIDQNEEIPRELIKKIAELGLMGISVPEEYGGGGFGEIGYCIMQEEIARGCASTATFIGAHLSIGATGIMLFGTEEQKQKYLRPLAEGKKIGAFALTESEAGSDASNIRSKAVLDGDYFILNGSKMWITNGNLADLITVFVQTEVNGAGRGISAFIIETQWEGFSVDKIEKKMGIHGSQTAAISFDNVKIPKENLLGGTGRGFIVAMRVLDVGRLGLGAATLGAAKECIDLSVKYARERKQFNQPIANFEAIQWMIAEMAADAYAMENMVYRTAWMCDQGMRFSREAAIVKMFCSESLDRIVDKAVQIHGGIGYSREYKIERMYRDARINKIFEGT